MRTLVITIVLLAFAGAAHAQSGSVRGLGINDAAVATASGYEAGLYNPARLATPNFSVTFLGARLGAGMSPVSVWDLAGYGSHLEVDEKDEILSAIRSAGGETVNADAAFHVLGLSAGNLALNIVTSGAAKGTLPPAIAEILLYGNVGQSGAEEAFTFESAHARAFASTSLAISYGREIVSPLPGRTAIGLTARYGLLHVLADGRDDGSRLEMGEEVLVSGRATLVEATSGHLYGVDLGLNWDAGDWSAGLVVRDALSGHGFSRENVEYTHVTANASLEGGSDDGSTTVTYDELLAIERADVDRRIDAPIAKARLVGGVARTFGYRFAAFSQVALGSTPVDPDNAEITLGTQLRPVGFLRLRGAGTLGTEDHALSGGLSVGLAGAMIDLSVRRSYGFTDGWAAGLGLRFGL